MVKPRLDDPLTADQLRAVLDYDPASGVFTWRRRDQLGHYARSWNTRYAGTVAGTPQHGYVQIMVNGWLYLAHRLAFLWMTGSWPQFEGDHKDGNPTNNRWSNLRDATRNQGVMNTRKRSDNTSGYKGVWFEKRRSHWVAEIEANGTKHYIGAFPTAEIAKAARDKAARRLHGAFARSE
jgi:hypothetical protein